MAFEIIITDAGRAALVNAQNTGTNPVLIATVGLSGQAIVATKETAALAGEIKRIATLSGDVVSDDTIHLTVRDESADQYAIRSIALYLADGTLFGAYGQPDPIMEKSAQSLLLLAIDVRFVDIAAPDLTFGDANFLNPPATVDRQGVVELATDQESTAGTDPERAVTPKALRAAVSQWLDDRLGALAPSAFVKSLLLAATAAAFRASLAIKSAALKDEGAGKGLDADLLDGQHGAWYADIPARLGYTPWHLNNDGSGSGLDADLVRGVAASPYGLSLLDDTNAAAARATLGLGTIATQPAANYALLAGAAFTGAVSVGGTFNATGTISENGYPVWHHGSFTPGNYMTNAVGAWNTDRAGANRFFFNPGGGTRLQAPVGAGGVVFEISNLANATLATFTADGDLITARSIDCLTPNDGTSGGLRVRGNPASGQAFIQITNAALTEQWGFFSCNSAGAGYWSGTFNVAGALTQGGNQVWHAGNLASAFAGTMAQNGYVILPNGLIIQWGRFTATANASTSVFFPIAFPNACFSVASAGGSSGATDSKDNPPVLLASTIAANRFMVFTADDTNGACAYIAIGF